MVNQSRSPRLTSALAFARNTWRGLTSMRTALVLLFLLALAALPGALLPQRSLNPGRVDQYLNQHPTIGPVLENLGFFEVFASTWFAAIYVLLFVSLVGCLTPRCWEYLRQLRSRPVRTPRNLERLPHYATAELDGSAEDVHTRAKRRLRGWRMNSATAEDGTRTISAERGYLREAGNLVFHFALLGLLVTVAGGKMYGYEGQVIVLANGSQFCNSGTYAYDSFSPGLRVDGTQLTPFCVRVNSFNAEYLPSGQAKSFHADVDYQSGDDLAANRWRPYDLQVNEPLRTAGDRVYLLGNGYAPRFEVTFPNGEKRAGLVQWQPTNQQTQQSQGATKFDPPGLTDPVERRKNQLAITGLFAPTASFDGKLLSSSFPDLRDPAVAVDVLRGDLGVDSGRGQSIFSVDQRMVESGRLQRVARENLRVGEQTTLADGTVVRFSGVERWVSLQVSHDPTQSWVLGFAIAIIVGIGFSLSIKRRRLWVRIRPIGDDPAPRSTVGARTVIEVGGLARTDQAGYGEEFTKLAEELVGSDQSTNTETSVADSVRGGNV